MLKKIIITICSLILWQFLDRESGFSALTNSSTIARITNNVSLVSTEKNDLKVYTLSSGERRECLSCKRILIQGALHGDEIYTTEFVDWLRSRVAGRISPLNKLSENVVFDFLPQANPDQFGKTRYNKRGINLNRNFAKYWGNSREPYGSSPFSEAETRAIAALAENRQYFAAFDIHGYADWIVSPSFPLEGQSTDNQQKNYDKWLSILGQHAKNDLQHQLLTATDLGDGGAFEDWMFWNQRTLAACIELNTVIEKSSKLQREKEYLKYESFIYNTLTDALKIFDKKREIERPSERLTLR
jgi:hypothetical protein